MSTALPLTSLEEALAKSPWSSGRHSVENAPKDGSLASWDQVCAKVLTCNREGMQHLRERNPDEAFRLLTLALGLLDSVEEQFSTDEERRAFVGARADTASNLGIYHRRMQRHDLAARYLQQALKLYKTVGAGLRTLVAAHLNLATCCLEAEFPDAALRHAMTATELGGQLVTAPEPEEGSGGGEGGLSHSEARVDDYGMLAVAYHKVGEAYEGLREWGKATFAYTQAYEVVKRSLGPHHHLTKSFERSSRCPSRITPSGPAHVRETGTPRRLPIIPNAKSRLSSQELPRYELSPEFFPQWPPHSASHEEHLWYAVARHHRKQQRVPFAVQIHGREPILDTFAR